MKRKITCKLVINGLVVEHIVQSRTVYQRSDGTRYVKVSAGSGTTAKKIPVQQGREGEYYYDRGTLYDTTGVARRFEHPHNSGNLFRVPDRVRQVYRERRNWPKEQWFPANENEEVTVTSVKGKMKQTAGYGS